MGDVGVEIRAVACTVEAFRAGERRVEIERRRRATQIPRLHVLAVQVGGKMGAASPGANTEEELVVGREVPDHSWR